MRLTVNPKDRKMSRQQWRFLDRELRIYARELQKAEINMLLFGAGAIEFSDEPPRSLSMEEISQLKFED